MTLAARQEFTITGEDVPGDQDEVSVNYRGLAGDVRPGTQLLVDDGRVVLEVTAVQWSSRWNRAAGAEAGDQAGPPSP